MQDLAAPMPPARARHWSAARGGRGSRSDRGPRAAAAQDQAVPLSTLRYADGTLHVDADVVAGSAAATWFEWAPDGARVAVALEDSTVEIRDGTLRELQRVLRVHDQRVMTLAWNHAGTRLATGGGDHALHVFKTDGWREMLMLKF